MNRKNTPFIEKQNRYAYLLDKSIKQIKIRQKRGEYYQSSNNTQQIASTIKKRHTSIYNHKNYK